MSAIPIIKRGEDLEFIFTLGGEDITGWICTIQVSQTPEDDFWIIERVIEPTENAWIAFLTAEETAKLSAGLYYLTGFLVNSTTDQERQEDKRFHVSPKWA